MTILVSGLINIETTISRWIPVAYAGALPFFGVNASVSGGLQRGEGAAYARQPAPFSVADRAGHRRPAGLRAGRTACPRRSRRAEHTPRSAILYDHGRRMVNVDLKDVQERAYPPRCSRR